MGQKQQEKASRQSPKVNRRISRDLQMQIQKRSAQAILYLENILFLMHLVPIKKEEHQNNFSNLFKCVIITKTMRKTNCFRLLLFKR